MNVGYTFALHTLTSLKNKILIDTSIRSPAQYHGCKMHELQITDIKNKKMRYNRVQ